MTKKGKIMHDQLGSVGFSFLGNDPKNTNEAVPVILLWSRETPKGHRCFVAKCNEVANPTNANVGDHPHSEKPALETILLPLQRWG